MLRLVGRILAARQISFSPSRIGRSTKDGPGHVAGNFCLGEHVLAACRAASRLEIATGSPTAGTKPQEQAFVENAWLAACGIVSVRPDHGTHVSGRCVTRLKGLVRPFHSGLCSGNGKLIRKSTPVAPDKSRCIDGRVGYFGRVFSQGLYSLLPTFWRGR